MWVRRLLNYIEQYRYRSLALLFLWSFIPIIGVFGIVIAALITLIKGALEGALFTIVTTIPLLIIFWWKVDYYAVVPLVWWMGIGAAIVSNILTWVLAVMLGRHTNWSNMIQIAALLGVLVISVVHLAYPDVANWWGNQMQSLYSQQPSKGAPTEAQADTISITKYYASGMMVSGILFSAFMQLIAARWLQSLVYSPRMLRRELHALRLSHLAGLLFMASIFFWYYGNSVVLDIMPVLYLLFSMVGLSIIHYFFSVFSLPNTWFWLTFTYIVMIMALPISVMALSSIALFDVWLDLRRRVKKIN